MALGSGIAERSRKTHFITLIAMNRSTTGMNIDEVQASTAGYRRKTVAELESIWKSEREVKAEGRS